MSNINVTEFRADMVFRAAFADWKKSCNVIEETRKQEGFESCQDYAEAISQFVGSEIAPAALEDAAEGVFPSSELLAAVFLYRQREVLFCEPGEAKVLVMVNGKGAPMLIEIATPAGSLKKAK